MGRSPCCNKHGLKKGTWTSEEDRKLFTYIQENGQGSWRSLPSKAGLQRCGKSCRLRWTNYLRPGIKRGQFSSEEEKTVIQLHALLGNRWSSIAAHLPKRTDNEIKNYWNTHLKKRLIKMGIDPTTHKPKNSITLSSSQLKRTANLSHMAQWETARLEAEARLGRGHSKLMMSISRPFHYNKPNSAIFPPLPCLDILKVWQGTWATNASITSSDFSPASTLNFIDNMLANLPSATKSAFATNSQPFPLMSYYDNSKVTEEQNRPNDDDLKCIIEQNEQHFDEFHDPLFMEDIVLSALPDHGNEDDAKYWNSILDDSATSFSYGSPTF